MNGNHRIIARPAATALLPLFAALLALACGGARAQSPSDIAVTDVRLSPRRVRPGGIVRVSMTLRKTARGPLVARSMRPSPRTVYTQGESFAQKGFGAQHDRYGVAIALSGPRGNQWPYRWGLGGDLAQGQIRRVSYPLRLTAPGITTIFVGVVYGDRVREISQSGLPGVEVIAPGRRARTTSGIIHPTPPTRITVNGRLIPLDQPPVFYESRITVSNVQILVPIRFVTEALGARVDWMPESQTAHIRRGAYDLQLHIGRKDHLLNDKTVRTHTPPRILGGRTMVPIRFVSQVLGGTVHWDNRTRTVAITLPPLNAAGKP